MKTTSIRARALSCALLAGTAYCGLIAEPAAAQSPTYRNLDSNGVDLVKGDFLTGFPEGSIGSGDAELTLLRMLGATGSSGTRGSSQWDHILIFVDSEGASVDFGSRKDSFPGAESRGATLSGGPGAYQYRSPDGTVMAFADTTGHNAGPGATSDFCGGSVQQTTCILLPTTITSPDGKVVTLDYEFWRQCLSNAHWGGPPSCSYTPRLARVANSYGYEIRFAYASGAGDGGSANPPADFHRRTAATFHNTSRAGGAVLASVTYEPLPGGVTKILDAGGLEWLVTANLANVSSYYGIRRPGAPSDTTSVSLSGREVTSVTNEGVTTQYSRSAPGNIATMTVTQVVPGGTNPVTTVVSDLTTGRVKSITDPLTRTTSYDYDLSGRLKRTTAPEDNYVEHIYDDRGNVTRTDAVSKDGAGPAIVTSVIYPETCANPVTCNRPISTTDARGQVTDYEYDPDHGGVTKVTSPAPTPAAPRPQTRYHYTIINGEHRLTRTSQCRTAASCEGTADEVRSVVDYDSNGNVIFTSSGDGTGALTAASTMTWDALGNLLTVDGPLPGTGDTGRIRYNPARQVVGTVSPDPDGAGAPLKPRATRNTYDPATGLLMRVEQGNVESQSDSDWAAFAPAQAVETGYDQHARPVTTRLVSGSTVHALVQTGYDALGRPKCTAQRMNPALFGTPPPPACELGTQGTGTDDHGPDRISRAFYDLAGRVTEVRTAVGITAAQSPDPGGREATEVATTYTPNGLVHTVTDGESNKTTYEYDGHDRLSRTFYPLPSPKGAATSNAADYEQLTYEVTARGTSGLVDTFRNRAGETIAFDHDALGRMISKDLPGSEPDVTYGYDLLGQMISASRPGHALEFAYDALGRKLREAGPLGTMVSEYDLAGRRTKLTWPDTFAVTYDHLVTGEMTNIRENGAALVTFGYDDLGRRKSLIRSNGTSTLYAYDSASRLEQLIQDPGGTTHDLTLGFTYNPAGQIASTTRSNDLYAWTGHVSGTTSATSNGVAHSANGLNQIGTWVGALSYDAKGNIVTDGTYGYGYSSENLLTSLTNSAPGAVQASSTFAYDPMMRLAAIDSSSPSHDSLLGYDGQDIAFENLGPGKVRRYVHGPGMDEPLVSVLTWSGGTGRDWYHSDERGSMIAISNSSGAAGATGKYDEYGVGTGVTRFHYTGQFWLADGNLHYYRARIYDPTLGRFLQPDPIGYGGGMNMYAYVGGDPVNFRDPLGLQAGDIIINGGSPTYAPPPDPTVIRLMDYTPGQSITYTGNVRHFFIGVEAGAQGERPTCDTPGADPYNCDPVVEGRRGSSLILVGANSPSGRTFGDRYTGRNRYRGALTDRSGGIVQAMIDIDVLAVLNGAPPLGMKNGITAPAAGWMQINPKGGGVIFRHGSTQIQLRITGGQVHIDFPAGTRLGTGVYDISEWGEVVHYD